MINEMQKLLSKEGRQLALAIPLLLLGCGNSDQPELGAVSGTVTLNGAPLSHVEISFAPELGRPSYGETDDKGKYELIYIRDTKGARIGKHKVSVHSTKVDHSLLKPVDVQLGPNVINIECTPNSQKPTPSTEGDT